MDKGRRFMRRSDRMAQAFEATPPIKGFEATKLIRTVMNSKSDTKKIEKLDRLSSRIDSYKRK